MIVDFGILDIAKLASKQPVYHKDKKLPFIGLRIDFEVIL